MEYLEYSVEIVDHRGVVSLELYRVSSKKVLDLVIEQKLKELPQPPKLVTIKEVKLELNND